MDMNESLATLMTPLFGFFALFILSLVLNAYSLALYFPLMIPVFFVNMVVVYKTRDKGYAIQREQDRIRREAEERWKRIFEQMYREEEARKERQRRAEYNRTRERYQRQQQAPQNNMANAVKLLGLPEGFTANDVKKAYRRLSKIHHPDVGGKQENFIKLKKAYDYVMSRI